MKKSILTLLCLVVFISNAQQIILSEKAKISILTVGTANQSHSLYGHTAIRIADPNLKIDWVYNYGMFDFSAPNFMLRFVKGDMLYYAGAYPYSDFEYGYKYVENRSIYEQVLNIDQPEKQALFAELNRSLASEDKFYTYKFIDRNCTTKVVEVLNKVLALQPIQKKNIKNQTYREVLFPFVNADFYQQLGINIIFGTKVDQQALKLFLPFDLLENIKVIQYKNKPLSFGITTLFEAQKTPNKFSFINSIYSLLVVLLLIILINKKTINLLFFSVLGLIGLLFSAIGLYSYHQELLWNYNVLLFNPLLLVLSFFILRKKTEFIQKTSYACLVFLAIYTLLMTTKVHFWIVLPLIICTATLLFGLTNTNKKKLLSSIK